MVEFHLPAVLATKIMQPLPGVATCWWPKDLDANLPHMVTCMAWSAQKYSLTVKALPDSSKISSMAALQAAKKNAGLSSVKKRTAVCSHAASCLAGMDVHGSFVGCWM